MKNKAVHLGLIIILSLSFVGSEAFAKRRPQSVDEPIRSELNQILGLASKLHLALFKGDYTSVDASLGKIMSHVVSAETELVREQKGVSHLRQVLSNIRGNLSGIYDSPEERKRQSIRSVFSNVVQIARNYRLDKYRLFFCSKDKSVWLQKEWKARNPFSPDTHKNCGSLIR